MSQVFISYARADANRARSLASALQQSRVPVWWDPEIALGEPWKPTLVSAINNAVAVVVLWSKSSARSEWVYREAEMALQQGNLVPVRIDPVIPPGKFAAYDCADLSAWVPNRPHGEFDQLRRHLLNLLSPQGAKGLGAWHVQRLNQETLLVRLDSENHTVRYSGGQLYVDDQLTVKGIPSVINERYFDFELRDGKQYYPAHLTVLTTMLRGNVKRLTLKVGGTTLYDA